MASLFKKLPMFLFSEYKELSSDAKIIYAVISDRKTLSEKNGWVDGNGVYVIFTLEEVSEYIPASKGKASRIMKELRDCGLISRKRMGQGKPDRIYVAGREEDAAAPGREDESYPQSPIAPVSCSEEMEPQSSLNETLKLHFSALKETDYIYTEGGINPSVCVYREEGTRPEEDGTDITPFKGTGKKDAMDIIIKNTGLDELPDDPVNELILDIIGEVMGGSPKETVRINGSDRPKEIIRSCFMKLDRGCIRHFVNRLVHHTDLKSVRNKRSYLRSMLYNAYFEHAFKGGELQLYGT